MRNKKIDPEKIENIKNNLMIQVEKLRDHCNQGSYKTRYRYCEAVERLCEYLALEFRLQKFSNLKSIHIVSYLQYMKDNGLSAATIKTDLSGIRFYHRLAGEKNKLPSNKDLNLEKRTVGQKDRAWTNSEIDKCLHLAKTMGRMDVYYGVKLSAFFGFRLEETVKCTVNHIRYALNDSELYVKGKGGQERFVPVISLEQRAVLLEIVQYAERQGKSKTDKIFADRIKGSTLSAKRRLLNWIANHRNKFQDDFRNSASSVKAQNNKKEKVQALSWHGLRYYFCQTQYAQLLNDKDAKRKLSEMLGHHRGSITDTYLNSKKTKKKK